MDAEGLVRVERRPGRLREPGHQLQVGEGGDRRDGEGHQERGPGRTTDLAGHRTGQGIDTGAENVTDDEEKKELGADDSLELGGLLLRQVAHGSSW